MSTPRQEDFLGDALDGPAAAAVKDDPVFEHGPVADDPVFESAALTAQEDVQATPLVEILPADFPLPLLTRFVADRRLKERAEKATAYALSIDVAGPKGLQRADLALGTLREAQKAIEAHFEEPASVANQLHKALTGKRGEWLTPGADAIKTVGNRVWQEQRRLEREEADRRRAEQEEADRQARESARKEAEAAAAAQAPEPVVEELKRQAEVATAPPVQRSTPVATMRTTTTVTTHKARLASSTADREPNPEIADLNPAELADVMTLLQAIVAGQAPVNCIELSWKYLNARAKADKSRLNIPSIVAYEDGGVRGKGGRRS